MRLTPTASIAILLSHLQVAQADERLRITDEPLELTIHMHWSQAQSYNEAYPVELEASRITGIRLVDRTIGSDTKNFDKMSEQERLAVPLGSILRLRQFEQMLWMKKKEKIKQDNRLRILTTYNLSDKTNYPTNSLSRRVSLPKHNLDMVILRINASLGGDAQKGLLLSDCSISLTSQSVSRRLVMSNSIKTAK